ncbi:MAG: DUF3341 domain-containing protein [Anaerolineae bacterium]|nr:DUF3341 domain-containing protein [Anaerolineae bacterium]
MSSKQPNTLYGVAAEFESAEQLLDAAREARRAGYRRVRAYSPYYIEGLADVLEKRTNISAWIVPVALLVGAFSGYMLQYWTSTNVYEFNIGGRPVVSWPSFMIITFEAAILFTALALVGTMFAQNALPLPYHPIFNTPNFGEASRSRFFLCIESIDPEFDLQDTAEFLASLEPINVSEVES